MYFKKRIVDNVFDELKKSNPLIVVGIPDGLGEKVCSTLRKKDNNNKFCNIYLDNEINTTTEINFMDLYLYNANIIKNGSVILLEDEVNDKAINWLVDRLNINSMYEIMKSIFQSVDEGYTVESIQNIIDTLVENKINLNQSQLFTIRNMVNFSILQGAQLDVVNELLPILDSIFENTSWSSRSTKRLFI